MRIFIISILLLVINLGRAQSTFESTGVTSDWNTATTWNETIALGDADGIPDKDDIVIILTGHTIDCGNTGFNECLSLTVNPGGIINLNSSSTNMLRIWNTTGNFTNNGTINGSGTIRTIYSITFDGSGTFNNVDIQKNNTNLVVDGDFTFENITLNAGANAIVEAGNTLTIEGTVIANSSASLFRNRGNLVINTASFLTGSNGPSTNFSSNTGNIVFNATGIFPSPFNSCVDVTILGNTSIENDITVTGDFTNNGTINFSGTPTITFNGSTSQSISGSGTCNLYNLTLNNSNGLSLASGNISISNVLTSTSGTITQNGANLTLVSSSANSAGLVKLNSASDYSYLSGDFTAQRYYNGSQNGWRMVAAPIKSATLADWDDEFTYCGISGGTGNYSYSGCGNFYSVYSYNESSANPSIDDGLSEVTSLGFGVSNATGTLIYTSSGVTTLSVTGTPEFDDIAKSVTRNNAGWNLVSNPYPSTINWTSFTGLNTNITGNVWYVYSADAANYFSSSSNIPHSQGFWINSSSSTNLNYSVSETAANQATFYKSTNGIDLPLKLKLTNNVNSYFDFAYLKTGSSYSNNFEPNADALKLFTPYPDYNANIFFLDNQGNSLDRSSINNNISEDVFFDVKIGQYAFGNYTIQFENLEQFMIGSCLQLEDLHNGVITDLRQDSIYTFASDTNAPSPRFKLQINVDYDINITNLNCFQDSSGIVTLNGSNLQGHYFNIIDTSGLLIDSVIAVSDSILFDGLNAGVYRYETNHVGTCPTQNQLIYITEPEEVVSLFSTISDTFYLDSNYQTDVNFKNLSSGSSHYEWDFGDGSNSQQFSVSHTYQNSGLYNVKLISKIDSLGSCTDLFEKTINIISPSLIVNNFSSEGKIDCNMINNILHLNMYDHFSFDSKLFILDISGKIILDEKINKKLQFDLGRSSAGIYLVKIQNSKSETIFTEKIIIN